MDRKGEDSFSFMNAILACFGNSIYTEQMDVPLEALEYSLIKTGLKRRNLLDVSYLEAGCGDGYNLERFTALGMQGVGIDSSKEAVVIARGKKLQGVEIIEGDFMHYRPKENHKIIFMLNILEHIEDDRAFIQQAYRVLPDSGYLVIATPTRSAAYGFADRNAGHVRRYEKSELIEKLQGAGFKIEEWLSVGFPINRTYTWLFNFLNRHRMRKAEQKTESSGIRTMAGYYGGVYDIVAPIVFPILTILIQLDRLFIRTTMGNNCIVFARKG